MTRIFDRSIGRGGLLAAAWIVALFAAAPAGAQAPTEVSSDPLLGAYSGSGVSDAQFCLDPLDEGLLPLTAVLNIDQTASFSGSGVTDDGTTFIIVGSLFSDGSVGVGIDFTNSVDGETGSLSGSGTFDGTTLAFQAFGGSNLCSIIFLDISFTKVGGSGGTLVTSVESSSEVTLVGELDAAVRGQPIANSSRVRTALRGNGTGALALNEGFMVSGMSAAEGSSMAIGGWIGYTRTDSKDKFVGTLSSADRDTFLLGFDTRPAENWLLGVSFGIESSDIDTVFNGGEQDVTAITVAPYVGALLTDWLTFDATVGYSDVSMEQFRTIPNTTTRVLSDVESERWFAAANVAATRVFDRVLLTGQAGMLWATQRDESFRESNGVLNPKRSADLGRFLLGGELAYSAGAWEPYVNGLYEYDFTRTDLNLAAGLPQPKNDDDDLLLSIGLRYFGRNNVSGFVEYSTVLGRSNLSEDSISANVRWAF